MSERISKALNSQVCRYRETCLENCTRQSINSSSPFHLYFSLSLDSFLLFSISHCERLFFSFLSPSLLTSLLSFPIVFPSNSFDRKRFHSIFHLWKFIFIFNIIRCSLQFPTQTQTLFWESALTNLPLRISSYEQRQSEFM